MYNMHAKQFEIYFIKLIYRIGVIEKTGTIKFMGKKSICNKSSRTNVWGTKIVIVGN